MVRGKFINSLLIRGFITENFRCHPLRLANQRKLSQKQKNACTPCSHKNFPPPLDFWMKELPTVPAVDLDDKKVLCFKRESPKSQTCQ